MTTMSVITVRGQIEAANESQIITYLTSVAGWAKIYNEPTERRDKETAQDFIDEIQGLEAGVNRDGARDRARRFLFRLAEKAAARNGF